MAGLPVSRASVCRTSEAPAAPMVGPPLSVERAEQRIERVARVPVWVVALVKPVLPLPT